MAIIQLIWCFPHASIPSLSYAHVIDRKYLSIGIYPGKITIFISVWIIYWHFSPLKILSISCQTHTLELVRTPSFKSASCFSFSFCFLSRKWKIRWHILCRKKLRLIFFAPIQYKLIERLPMLIHKLISNKLNWPYTKSFTDDVWMVNICTI